MSSIGIFDSGLGGLTVLREAIKQFPSHDLIYLADTARVPYGGRSEETIIEYALDAAHFFSRQPIQLLIVACHTVSSRALPHLARLLPIPVIGMIQGGIDELCQKAYSRIAILGTTSTIESGVYQSFFHSKAKIKAISCPLFVPLIEEGFVDHPAMELIARHYLEPLKRDPVDAVLLGCTHYPLIRPILQKILGHVAILEPAPRVISDAKRLIQKASENHIARRTFYVTDAPEKFRRQASSFLGAEILENIEKVSLTLEKKQNAADDKRGCGAIIK